MNEQPPASRRTAASPDPARPVEQPATPTHDIVVIGASAGAVSTLQTLASALPRDFPAAVFVVVHISAGARSELADILMRAGPLPASHPDDMTAIAPGQVYVSSPDCHMLIERDHIRIARGPKENRHRPAIDPLFRSAAWSYGPRVIGVVLTGFLDDGTAGLWAIRTCGGVTIVQDPHDAVHPEMPQNALTFNQVDYVLSVEKMGPLLDKLARQPVHGAYQFNRPPSMKTEVEFQAMEHNRDIKDMSTLGRLSPFTCPSCRGSLWELQEDDLLRYRCHTGHGFNGESLLAEQTCAIEEGLYSALRAVEEKAAALRRLSVRWGDRYPKMEADYLARAKEMEQSAHVLRRLLAEGDM